MVRPRRLLSRLLTIVVEETLGLSVALVVPTPAAPVQSADDFYIYTWRSFRAVRMLSERPSAPWVTCRLRAPRTLTIAPGEIAVRVVAGTTVVNGVSVTMDGPEAHLAFKPGQQYVMIVNVCPEQVAILPHSVGGCRRCHWGWSRRC
jgi:hypothetical protein